LFLTYSAKISVKGKAAQIKVKTAKKLVNFSGIEISTLINRILNSFIKTHWQRVARPRISSMHTAS